jgi:hypothetical protein
LTRFGKWSKPHAAGNKHPERTQQIEINECGASINNSVKRWIVKKETEIEITEPGFDREGRIAYSRALTVSH